MSFERCLSNGILCSICSVSSKKYGFLQGLLNCKMSIYKFKSDLCFSSLVGKEQAQMLEEYLTSGTSKQAARNKPEPKPNKFFRPEEYAKRRK